MAITDFKFKIVMDGQELPRGWILNPIGAGLYQTCDWPVSIERIGEHFIVKAGCQKLIVHNYKEARAWLLGMADNYVKPMFERKT